jgi:hypothetical protein
VEDRFPVVTYGGVSARLVAVSHHQRHLYHLVVVGHLTALKALRMAIAAGHSIEVPAGDQVPAGPRPYSPYSAYAPPGPDVFSVSKLGTVEYPGRILGDQEKGLYTLALWADPVDLLEKVKQFYLVDPQGAPVPIRDVPSGQREAAPELPRPDIVGRFFAWLDHAMLTPLLPAWAERLWQAGCREPSWSPMVKVAYSIGASAWVVEAGEPRWDEVVRKIVRDGGDEEDDDDG